MCRPDFFSLSPGEFVVDQAAVLGIVGPDVGGGLEGSGVLWSCKEGAEEAVASF